MLLLNTIMKMMLMSMTMRMIMILMKVMMMIIMAAAIAIGVICMTKDLVYPTNNPGLESKRVSPQLDSCC